MNWPQYFMTIAQAAAARSKDPRTKVGAVIVNHDNHIIGTGYNGMLPGTHEGTLWSDRDTKYLHVVHAEANALLHCSSPVRGATLYCTLTPCAHCYKLAVTAGIKQILYSEYREDHDRDTIISYIHNPIPMRAL